MTTVSAKGSKRPPSKFSRASRARRELTEEELNRTPDAARTPPRRSPDASAEELESDIVRVVRHGMAAQREILSTILAVLDVSQRTLRDTLGSLSASLAGRRRVARADNEDGVDADIDVVAKKPARVAKIEEIKVE